MQQKAHADAWSGYVESGIRLAKNQQHVSDAQFVDNARRHLATLMMLPLRKRLEVTAPIPLDLLPSPASSFIRSLAASQGISVEMAAVCVLGAIFIAARGNFRIKVSDLHYEVLTAFILLAASSGERKSAGLGNARRVFEDVQLEWQQKFSYEGKETENKVLQKALKRAEAELAKKLDELLQDGMTVETAKSELRADFQRIEHLRKMVKKRATLPRILLDTPTLEALAVELERQGEALGIFEAEGGFWKNRLRSFLDDILLKAYTGEPFGSDTKTLGSVSLQAPVLAICTLVQPNVLEDLYSDDELVGHGLIPRILPLFAPSQGGIRNRFPPELQSDLIKWYREHIRALLNIRRPAGQDNERTFHDLPLTPEAKAEIDRYGRHVEDQIQAGLFDRYPAFANKLVGHAVRLAGATHLLKHTAPQDHAIDQKTVACGIAFAEFFRQHAAVAFTPEARDGITYAPKILSWMTRHRPFTFTEREAQRGVGHCNAAQVRAGIDELERHGYLLRYTNGTTHRCVVHPNLYTQIVV